MNGASKIHLAGGNVAREARNKRHAHSAVPGFAFSTAQSTGSTQIPGPVIAGEDDQRVLVQIILLERLKHLPDAPVDLRNGIGVAPLAGASLESARHAQRDVREGVREIQEE